MSFAGDLVKCASQGDGPEPELQPLRVFVERARSRTQALDEMATGELTGEAVQSTLLDIDGCSYELLLLAHAVHELWDVAGVVALATSDAPFDRVREGQLLSALAAQLRTP
jgi:hypothetical protein